MIDWAQVGYLGLDKPIEGVARGDAVSDVNAKLPRRTSICRAEVNYATVAFLTL